MNIGLSLKVARTERELKLRELASKLEISTSYLSLLENNKRDLSFDLLVSICYVLQFAPSEIVKRAEGYETPYIPSDDDIPF